MEHLSLEIFDLPTAEDPKPTGSRYAVLPEDTGITITSTSEVFASGDVWSYSFTLNTRANVHIFGSAGEMHGSRLHGQLDRRRARLWVEGIPLHLGYLRLSDEAEVDSDGNVDVSFEGGVKTFEEKIEGAKANQVPMMRDVMFGVALWRKRWVKVGAELKVSAKFTNNKTSEPVPVKHDPSPLTEDDEDVTPFRVDGETDSVAVQQYPRMVFPKGTFFNVDSGQAEEIDCVNTDYPYDDEHPYCNVTLCYQKYGYTKKNEKEEEYDDYSGEPEAQRGYEVMPADRVNSAPNFFVIYWLRALMKHLGIHIQENQMMDVEDLRRLFFVNTACHYREPDKVRNPDASKPLWYRRYRFGADGLGERLVPEQFGPRDGSSWKGASRLVKTEECSFAVTSYKVSDPHYVPVPGWQVDIPTVDRLVITVDGIAPMTSRDKAGYEDANGWLHGAYATPDCFPDADISEVISALEAGFGMRLLFSDDYQRVRIVLLRNIFRSQEVRRLDCDVLSDGKVENAVRGFRMTYGGSTDDTAFYYKGFADMLPHQKTLWPDTSDKHDYSKWSLSEDYPDVIHKVSAFNKTCYVTPVNGNAYGIKVDKDAKRYRELHPSLFEYAGYMDAEDGDCTGEEETIETVSVGFTPAIMNDLNWQAEQEGDHEQKFALFVDEAMRPRRPDLEDGADYDDPQTAYYIDEVPEGEEGRRCLYGEDSPAASMKADDGVVKPGEFAITSDMFAAAEGLKATLKHTVYYEVPGQEGFNPLPVTWDVTDLAVDGHVNEGYRLYLQDNYEPNDDGVPPVETHKWGLTLGIMRGSGRDARIVYSADPDDMEGNDTWEKEPGSSITVHPDTCDNYGNIWDYDSWPTRLVQARYLREKGWTVSGADDEEVTCSHYFTLHTAAGHVTFHATPIKLAAQSDAVMTREGLEAYVTGLWETYGQEAPSHDTYNVIISIRSTDRTFYADGRVSLKLRAEKPNPKFDRTQPESASNRRYLEVGNGNLARRGLCDQFYSEYSKWVRESRIAKMKVRMELSQLQAIDKTVKVTVGDVTGFIRKMQYTVSASTGLGLVDLEIMYI